ncbi:hypothetical protein H696_03975 [Fonticula alba]|uniref:Uncharacterized protein n=1 Tax=Fonticula alba TaxID=691883 RepID=A0A058Z5K4_FONAL|nr:hypothetical protein H696_03975 [Fonticula alba]KCV69554.1 hypothetical protein H696_03975 [Fonticula alba]|eukprot:XP_009496119.1 hypothetical protein H696_03975 [Fonticula alba]
MCPGANAPDPASSRLSGRALDSFDPCQTPTQSLGPVPTRDTDGHFCLAWSPSRSGASVLAVGCQRENCVKLFTYVENLRKWEHIASLAHTAAVNDLAWAPEIGRTHNLLATCSRDGRVRIWRVPLALEPAAAGGLLEPAAGAARPRSPPAAGAPQITVQASVPAFPCTLADDEGALSTIYPLLDDVHSAGQSVWRVSWNLTGTTLASSGDNGCVRLYGSNLLGRWTCFNVLASTSTSRPASELIPFRT